jgi:hypothetical protein
MLILDLGGKADGYKPVVPNLGQMKTAVGNILEPFLLFQKLH